MIAGRTLAGQRVVVTGAAGGIGSSITRGLIEAEVKVVAVDRDHARLLTLSQEIRGDIATQLCDVTDQSAVQRVFDDIIKNLGPIDALIHCAGMDAPPGCAWSESPDHWREIIDVDLNAVWWCARAVLPHMIARRTGRIVLISSVAARSATINSGISVAYNAAKAGVNGLTVALSAQVENSGILVNAIAPGPTGTGTAMTAKELEQYKTVFPLGEGGPEPVTHACLYLLGPGGDWVSGSVLNVSGGKFRG
ncbi:SDR family NAD(P)-dependent oxidoreductase [Mesorhizobium wenxiniae]|nr:SDR family NAD(P)-dependent oxidoreductase [Mesorhizobium wenxiniae]